jgi:CheY-like chemotaxis protein
MTQKSAKRKSASRKAKPETAEVPVEAQAERPQTCVLLVEDEVLIAEIIGEALAESGHAVHAVANAQDAIAHLSNGGRVDLLFTDINLPGDMDGVGLAEQARAVNPQLPVLFSSGRWWRLEELQKLPNAATLRKPYSPARACEAVELLLAERTSGADDAGPEREAALAL